MEVTYKLKRAFFKLFPHLMKSSDYIQWLNHKGVCVGKGTYFFGPASTQIDVQRPWMLHIGEYCKITSNVTILCHDYSRSVLRRVYGDVVGEAKETFVGDNVFIGMNSIILMGAHIGNNTIVGAGSIVSGTFPDNVVIAGNPARVIRTLDEHYTIRKSKMLSEAVDWEQSFEEKYHRAPSENEMGPFWQIFMPRSKQELDAKKINYRMNGDEESEVLSHFLKSSSEFEKYEDFIKYCSVRNNKARGN